jgi:hypothetical protein
MSFEDIYPGPLVLISLDKRENLRTLNVGCLTKSLLIMYTISLHPL